MSALGPSEISARRRPGLIATLIGLRLLLGFCLSFPLASLVASSGVGLRAEGDRALFESGGYLLLELLRTQGDALAAAVRGLLPLFGAALLLGAAGNVLLLVALDVRERLTSFDWLARAWARLPAHLVVAAGAALTKALLLMLATIAVAAIPVSPTNPVATSLGQAACMLPFLLLLGAVGGLEDVAKAALVRHDATLEQGLARAVRGAARRPLSTCFGFVPYGAVFVLAALLAAPATEWLDVSQPGVARLVAVFLVHQLVIAIGVVCRAAWFARALRLAATTS